MKTNEILQALKLPKNKNTSAYCSKLEKVYAFLNSNKKDITQSLIVESDLNIDSSGEVFSNEYVNKDYANELVDKFRYADKAVIELVNKCTDNICEQNNLKEKSGYNVRHRKSSKLTTEKIAEIEAQLQELTEKHKIIYDARQALIETERQRLYAIQHPILDIRKELNLLTGNKIEIETIHGNYKFIVPVDNKFYSEVCGLLGLAVIEPVKEVKAFKVIDIDSEVLEAIKKAIKFTSKDNLRPAMQNVLLQFKNNTVEVVATDAHRLYQSKLINCNCGSFTFQIMLDATSLKAIAGIKTKSEAVTLELITGKFALLNGLEINLFNDAKFPDYKVVIPEYKTFMTFDRQYMFDAVKSVKQSANKSTHQVNLYLNGEIELSAQDVDFAYESKHRMNYTYKDFEDTTIGFNGNFLCETLSIFKAKEVKMLSEGSATKAAIFTDGIDKVLLMPLMLNN